MTITQEVITKPKPKIPEIKVRWLRLQDHFAFSRPLTFLVLGMRGCGKSSLLEVLAIRYPKILDMFGSSDSEGLCWCKREFTEFFEGLYGRKPRILLVVGKSKDVASEFDSVKPDDLTLSKIKEYDVVTTVHAFFKNDEEYFNALHGIVELLWIKRTYWTEPWFVLIREAANWIYARIKVVKNDQMAKAEFIKSLREARHHGLAIGVDTIRWTGIDKEIRDVCDFTFIKRVGIIGLPDDLRWLYRYYNPISLMNLKASVFGITTTNGAVGFGRFDYPPWHKEERENILASTNIEIKNADQQVQQEDKRYGLGSFEHAEIIKQYISLGSLQKVADAQGGRNPSTIMRHINKHNLAIEKKGFCKICQQAKGEFEKDYIKDPKKFSFTT